MCTIGREDIKFIHGKAILLRDNLTYSNISQDNVNFVQAAH